MPDVEGTMVGYAATQYRPGGSLRAWRDYFPRAVVHGLDIAADTQITGEPRIHTHLCDATNSEQVRAVLGHLGNPPELIVDDGPHGPDAQVQVFRNFFPALTPGGLYVLEDVLPDLQTIQQLVHQTAGRTMPSLRYYEVVRTPTGSTVLIAFRKA